MGLAIAKGFVEAMGGTIAAGPGELGPLHRDAALAAPGCTGMTGLDPDRRGRCGHAGGWRTTPAVHGYQVDEAGDVRSGSRMGRDRPDVILLDLGPGSDGSGHPYVRREASTRSSCPPRPGKRQDRRTGSRGDDYVAKPFGIGEVRARAPPRGAPAGNRRRQRVLRNGSIALDPGGSRPFEARSSA
jgi:hypothetical protein